MLFAKSAEIEASRPDIAASLFGDSEEKYDGEEVDSESEVEEEE